MSRNKAFTGPLAEHIQNFLDEKRALGFKYEEQARLLSVLDVLSLQYDCSNGLSKELCFAFIEKNPNWRQKTQEARVTLIRAFAEYLIRHEIPAYMVDYSIVTNMNEDFKPYIFTHSQIADILWLLIQLSLTQPMTHTFSILQFSVFNMAADCVFQKLLACV